MKKCPHCGKKLPQEMQFCPYCMEKLMVETEVGVTPVHRHRRRWLWIATAILFLLLLCGLWLWRPWERPAPAKEADAAPSGEVTTTTTVTTVDAAVSDTTTAPAANQPPTTTATPSTDKVTTTSTTTTTSAVTASQTGVASRTTATTAATTPCGQGHSWEAITKTVQVDEVGHYETKMVEKRVTVYRCALCYKEHLALDDYYAHFDAEHGGDALQGVFRDRYTEAMEYREVEEQTWVVDTPAYDKTVTVGRRCPVCGKTETNEDKE